MEQQLEDGLRLHVERRGQLDGKRTAHRPRVTRRIAQVC